MQSLAPLSCNSTIVGGFATFEASTGWAVIHADINSQDPAQVTAALQHGYVIGGWIAMILHALGTELYVSSPQPPNDQEVMLTSAVHSCTSPKQSL